MTDCIFCDIVRGEAPASVVYDDGQAMAFMDIQPVNPGHVLVVPKVHAAYLSELNEGVGAHLFQVAVRIAGALRQSGTRCEGINIFLADGEAASQEILHVHLHIIPRFTGDGFELKFGPNYHQSPSRAALNQIAGRIRRALDR